ncbi:MAG: PIG-L deacetylase family protein [Bacillota bacterium]
MNIDINYSIIHSEFKNSTSDIKYLVKPKGQKVLIIAPHPDDEILGCGGTLCKHIDENDFVSVLYLTNGEKGGNNDQNIISEQRYNEAIEVLKECGVAKYFFFGLKDQAIDINSVIINRLADIIAENFIDLIYLPHLGDSHVDHFSANILLANALNKITYNDISVLGYEIWSPAETNLIINISNEIERKNKLLKKYKSQLENFDFWTLSKSLSEYRAHSCIKTNASYIKAIIKENKMREKKGLTNVFPWSHVEAFHALSKEEYCSYIFERYPSLQIFEI